TLPPYTRPNTLSLHDALPILSQQKVRPMGLEWSDSNPGGHQVLRDHAYQGMNSSRGRRLSVCFGSEERECEPLPGGRNAPVELAARRAERGPTAPRHGDVLH